MRRLRQSCSGAARALRALPLLAALLLAAALPAAFAAPAAFAVPAPPAPAAAPPAEMAETAPPAAPRFLIETITVRGNRRPASGRIVVSESLLVAGGTYGEEELRDAIYRIKRLPFIIAAEFSLQKGSARGRYELVVRVEESRPLFASLDLRADVAERSFLTADGDSRRFETSNDAILGAREFVGSEGVVFASLQGLTFSSSGGTSFLGQAGYARYDLFGPGSYASLSVAVDSGSHTVVPTFTARVPLDARQSLGGSLSWSRDSSRFAGLRSDFETRSALFGWLYNTTDDPLFTTRGTVAQADLSYRVDRTSTGSSSSAEVSVDSKAWSLSLNGRRYLPLTSRQSLAFGLGAGVARQSFDRPVAFQGSGPFDSYRGQAEVRHSLDLWQGVVARRRGELRWESFASYTGSWFPRTAVVEGFSTRAFQLDVGSGLLYRSPWATLRFGLTWHGKVSR